MHETQPRHQDVTAEVMHMSQAGSLQGPSGVMGGHNQLLGVSMGDSRRWDRQRRRGDPSAFMFGFRSRRWDRRCRAIRGSGIGGASSRIGWLSSLEAADLPVRSLLQSSLVARTFSSETIFFEPAPDLP